MPPTVPPADSDLLPQGEQKAVAVRAMFDRIAPRYDLVNRIMTFRMDVGWRRKTVDALLLHPGSVVLDLASGTGDLCRELDRHGLRSIGVDFSLGMLAASNVGAPRVQADALRLPVPDAAVDGVTCGFALRNFVDLAAFLAEVARVVRPGGRLALLEVSEPRARVLRWGHGVYFGTVVPRIGALLSDGAAYRYLPRSVAYLPPTRDLLEMLRAVGFDDVRRFELSSGIAQLIVATRSPEARLMAELVARTRRLDVDVDLLAVAGEHGYLWTRGRVGLAGRGDAARIEIPRHDPATAAKAVHDALGAIDADDEVGVPGCGPVALGALPFDPTADGTLVVPRLVVGRAEDGTRWVTAVSEDGALPAVDDLVDTARGDADDAAGDRAEPARFRVDSERPVGEWCAALEAARAALRAGSADKVVLARAVTVEADVPLSVRAVLERLRATYPACMLFSVDGFVGATPELLVARAGDLVRSHPMAGTAPRSDDPTTDARLAATLIASTKDRREHRLTIDMVHDTLLPWCSYLDEEAEPSIVAMANVQHLATSVEGRLSTPPASVVELMVALHPTPAVGGAPRAAALDLIDEHETTARGRFGGPVGWVDSAGNGAWAVGIRSAEIHGTHARLLAGVGVLPDSDTRAELAETRAKMQAVLGAIVRP